MDGLTLPASLPASPSRTQKLREVFAEYHSSTSMATQIWWSQLMCSLDVGTKDAHRLFNMKTFLANPSFVELMNSLLDHIDELPRSFANQVFDCSCSPPVPRPRANVEELLKDLREVALDWSDRGHCLEVVLRHVHK